MQLFCFDDFSDKLLARANLRGIPSILKKTANLRGGGVGVPITSSYSERPLEGMNRTCQAFEHDL